MDYGNLFLRAWKITWNNKLLWILGFFAGLGNGVSFNNNFRGGGNGGNVGPNQPGGELSPEMQEFLRQLQRPEVVGIFLTVVCVLLLIAVALFVLGVISRAGLIGGVRLADDNGKVSLGEAWAVGVRFFWRMLGLELLQLLPLVVLVIGGVALAVLTAGVGLVCLLPLLCVAIILIIPYNLVFWLAGYGLVLENLGVFDSVKRGWEMLKNNVAPVLIVGGVLFVGLFVVGLATLIPLIVIAVPVMFAFVADPQHPNLTLLAGAGLAFLCLLPILWVFTSMLTTWVYSVWTLLYRQLAGPTPAAPALAPAAPQAA